MAQRTSTKNGGKRDSRQQAVFRRRRIVAGVAAVMAVAFVVFCVYSLSRGLVAISNQIHHADVYALSREEAPSPAGQRKSGIPDCDAKSVSLTLTPAASSFAVGGSLDFTTSVAYDGSGKVGCLVDVSTSGVILEIQSGDDVIWRSDVCVVDSDYRLIAKGDEVKQTVTWPGTRTGDECAEDQSTLPKVDRGTYTARISLAGKTNAKSDLVAITVE